jgi:hypothetical protein
MAQVMYQYYQSGFHRNQGVINLYSDTIKLALVLSTYTPDLDAHKVWADVSAHEVAAGAGYSSGGAILTGKTLTRTTWKTIFDADDVTFTALTKTFRYGVLYVDAIKADPQGGADVVKPLLAYILFDDTPADVVVSGVNYLVQWSSLGIMNFGPYASF